MVNDKHYHTYNLFSTLGQDLEVVPGKKMAEFYIDFVCSGIENSKLFFNFASADLSYVF